MQHCHLDSWAVCADPIVKVNEMDNSVPMMQNVISKNNRDGHCNISFSKVATRLKCSATEQREGQLQCWRWARLPDCYQRMTPKWENGNNGHKKNDNILKPLFENFSKKNDNIIQSF
jgi:hypothetical protein